MVVIARCAGTWHALLAGGSELSAVLRAQGQCSVNGLLGGAGDSCAVACHLNSLLVLVLLSSVPRVSKDTALGSLCCSCPSVFTTILVHGGFAPPSCCKY